MLAAVPHVIAITPFELPDFVLATALSKSSALAVLDLGRDVAVAERELASLVEKARAPIGVRVCAQLAAISLPDQVAAVVVDCNVDFTRFSGRIIIAQVTSIEEARDAIARGADALIAKGEESGGRVGRESGFVLMQRIVSEFTAPVWVQGGIGIYSAAACIAGGARGVVIDSQLALLREARTSSSVRHALATFDGSDTIVISNRRIYVRRGVVAPAKNASSEEIDGRLGDDLSKAYLALGQEAVFARPWAERYVSAGAAVRALEQSMFELVRDASQSPPFAPASPLAKTHRIDYPIFQGPMTRVSDRAAFAKAVADAGALPFLALSLMAGDELRSLLSETRELLGDKPWGVGILGFLPGDLREQQLAVVRELSPPVALIAGGRPSQARPLEEHGIVTYLHVPSPGLLDMFLKDGARRFIFEGRECGGHVGPRSSFVLWEQAIARLLECESTDGMAVIFAGGIHDARSAAMVSAMAAPLRARGIEVGVLMGTAYLFTHEVVSAGAITPVFQEEAIRCEQTALVETAPGHATRCADTEYVRAFETERKRLENEGHESKDIWEKLERFNLGRLRLASKGLRRDGDELVTVSEKEQHDEGLFMIGEVAALRHERLTMRALHLDVCEGGALQLSSIPLPARAEPASPKPVDIAIIGTACIFAGAPDLATYWKNIALGVNSISEVPPERWNPDVYFDKAGTGEKTPSKWGGFLADVAFDPTSYGIPPNSLASIDPAQLLSLEVARRALDDAGYAERDFARERTSVIFGAEAGTDLAGAYGFRATYPQFLGAMPSELDAALPRLTEDSFPGVLSNVIAGRVANRLDLGGVNFTVDAACASSLAAVNLACNELVAGSSDMVLAGGADLHNSINDYLLFASVHALSPTGQCRTFDASADGIALGEGVAVAVLKRLADAERDGDRILAVIKSVAGSSDGKSLGLTAPRKEGQVRALERAYAQAGVKPASVELVEAHGTGTVVGDRTELATLTEFFGRVAEQSERTAGACALGSVKSQIGHTKCAAGLAGVIKAALSIYHRTLPPTLNIVRPNPYYDASKSPFSFNNVARPWLSRERIAGVSAFGFGGANFHCVLASHDSDAPPSTTLVDWPAELLVFRGKAREDASATIALVLRAIELGTTAPLRDLAASVSSMHAAAPVRLAIVALGIDDLHTKLIAVERSWQSSELVFVATDQKASPEEVAFIFPGQGSQRPGMLGDLFVTFPDLHDLLRANTDIASVMLPHAAFSPDERAAQQKAITDTRVAQPALGIAGLAMARLLARFGVEPSMTAGHSYGELVALAVAGALDSRDLIALSKQRGDAIADVAGSSPGAMAAVRASFETVTEALASLPGITIANRNAPDQIVIAGSSDDIDAACKHLTSRDISARKLNVSCAFHSPIVAAAVTAFAPHVNEARFGEATIPVYSNTTGAPYPTRASDIRALLSNQLAKPVLFETEIEAMYAAGARVFVEVGPGGVLTDLTNRILHGKEHAAIATDNASDPALSSLLAALAQLSALQLSIDTTELFQHRATSFDLSSPPVPSTHTWLINGQYGRPLHTSLPDHALRPDIFPISVSTSPMSIREPSDAALIEYLRGMRELVEGQRQVMLRYLGAQSPERLTFQSNDDLRVSVLPSAQAMAPQSFPFRAESIPPPSSLAVAPTPAYAPPVKTLDALIAIVSERTGYPPEMLEPDLDLEADLGIDSIKRIEILGKLRDRLHLKLAGAEGQSEAMEQLAGVKTIRGIAEWIEARRASEPMMTLPAAINSIVPPARHVSIVPAVSVVPPSRVERFVLELGELPPAVASAADIRGRRFAITKDQRGVALKLAALLEARGASTQIVDSASILEKVDGLVHLAPLVGNDESTKELFSLAKSAIEQGAQWIIAATAMGGAFGHDFAYGDDEGPASTPVSGLMKSIAKEAPSAHVRTIDVNSEDDPATLAAQIYAELLANDSLTEVGYRDGVRRALTVMPEPPSSTDFASRLKLSGESVVMITGGARGITARVAIALAKRFKCQLELVGRSPLPTDEDPEFAAALDEVSLRKAIISRAYGAGPSGPAAIDKLCREILTAREIRNTIAAITAAGARINYHAVDVRNGEALGRVVDNIYAHHGRLDGIIHGAGVVEDKLLKHKTRESFDRVFDTKVASARTLVAKVRPDIQFIVFFSSVSGAFGNRGQVDYAAANDTLDKLAHDLHRKMSARVLSINWGPWGGVGMVSPELESEYLKRGVGLISPEAGVVSFMDELLYGHDTQVILMAPEASP